MSINVKHVAQVIANGSKTLIAKRMAVCGRYFLRILNTKLYNMENLKALVFGKQLTAYQRALAQREFKDIVERLELLEKVVKNNAVLPHVSKSVCRHCGAEDSIVDILFGKMCEKCEKII